MKAYLWKRKSEAYVDGQLKATVWTEFSFDASGKVQTKVIDAETSVKQKPGLRGAAQKNAIDAKMEYVEKALDLSLRYCYMTKGQLLDFFSKATRLMARRCITRCLADLVHSFSCTIFCTGI